MSGPLSHIKVLDLTRMGPGPFCTMLLGDLGADVLRIEGAGGGRALDYDKNRRGQEDVLERVAMAHDRNKRSIALNLKNKDAQHILHQLVKESDVLVEGNRPGVTKRLACDYATLNAINPRLVYCSITGYGQNGPYEQLAGHDLNYISFAGCVESVGPKNGPPVIPHNIIADYGGGGAFAAIGILAALNGREKTGKGQHVDVSMMDSVQVLMSVLFSYYFGRGERPRRSGGQLNGGFPQYSMYECKDGKYISIGCLEPWFWANLCKHLGREDLAEAQLDTANHPKLFAWLEATFKTKTRDEWFDELRSSPAGDIAVAKVLTLEESVNDPHTRARQMIAEVGKVDGRVVRQVGIAPKLSATPGSVRRLAPKTGEHTDEVLNSLGYSPAQVKALREQGTVA
ncbi:MAG: CoA transferase [Chloroflexi bacterium]|nr:CoA transferase [Chloroflexota bacterium]